MGVSGSITPRRHMSGSCAYRTRSDLTSLLTKLMPTSCGDNLPQSILKKSKRLSLPNTSAVRKIARKLTRLADADGIMRESEQERCWAERPSRVRGVTQAGQ